MSGRLAHLVAAAFGVAILVLSAVRPLGAHTALLRSDPAAGARLTASPRLLRLVFSEAIEGSLGRVSVVTPSGRVAVLTAAGDPRDVRALMATVAEPLGDGEHRVRWRIVSADGHAVSGSFAFAIATAQGVDADSVPAIVARSPATVSPDASIPSAPASAATAPPDRAVESGALRGAGVGALALLAGLLLFARGDAGAPGSGVRGVALALGLASAVALGAHAALWSVEAAPDARGLRGALASSMESVVGQLLGLRVALALLALWALGLARRGGLALPFAVAALGVTAFTGHAAAATAPWITPAKAVHLAAGAVWCGGVLWLVVRRWGRGESDLAAVRRVSSAAFVAVVLVAGTGTVQALDIVPSLAALTGTAYGRVLLAKLAGVLVLVALGAWHRKTVQRWSVSSAPDGFRRTIRAELILMTGVLALSGVLASLSPSAALERTLITQEPR